MPSSTTCRSAALIAAWSLSLLHCGGAKPAQVQYRGTVPVPSYPADPSQPFQLTDAQGALEFEASLIFWSQTPQPEQIRAILDTTRNSSELKANALKFLDDQLIPAKVALAASQAKYDAFDAQIAAGLEHADPAKKRDYLRGIASNLVAKQLSDLASAKQITDDDKAHAEAIFPAYCEAKLWELAANPQLANRFMQRPSPVELCETYYTAQKYFADPALCGPAAGAAGKDYFSCLWTEGVMKSVLLTDAYKNTACTATSPLTEGQALANWLLPDGGVLKQALLVGDSTLATQLQVAIMQGTGIPFHVARKYRAFNACRKVFQRVEPVKSSAEDTTQWASYFPSSLLLIGEAKQTDSPPFDLLPRTSDDAVNRGIYQKLVLHIRNFGLRPGDHQEVPSYSDEAFNIVVGAPLKTNDEQEHAVDTDRVFSGLLNFEPAEVKALRAQQAAAQAALTKQQASYATLSQQYQKTITPEISNALWPTIDAAKSPGATVFLNNYSLSVDKVGGHLRVTTRFDLATRSIVGCVNIADGAPCVVTAAELGDGVLGSVAFDGSADLITVKFVLTDPAALGFPAVPRSSTGIQFNDIPVNKLQGRTVEINNYANKLHDNLNILGGTAYIDEVDGTQSYIGSLTGDNFAQREGELKLQYGAF